MSIKLDASFKIPVYSPVCSLCRHLRPEDGEFGRTCAAFPKADRIPLVIWEGENKHRSAFPGDHGIQFESATKEGNE
jgi:hypothetical protein